MKTIIFIILISIGLFSCNHAKRFYDSEISAIRDQTEVLKEHNKLIKQQNELLIQIINKK